MNLTVPQGHDGVDAQGAACGNGAGQKGEHQEHHGHEKKYLGTENGTPRKPAPGLLKVTFCKRSGSRKGRERSKTAFTILKIAVLAPMPNASVRMMTAVNRGDLRKTRSPNFISWITVCITWPSIQKILTTLCLLCLDELWAETALVGRFGVAECSALQRLH